MKSLPATIALAAALFPGLAGAQVATLELDHVYLLVPPGAAVAVDALRRAGVTIDTTPQRHDGEGTTSIAAFFENGYLELMWVDSSLTVDANHQDDVAAFRRGTDWRETGASPFGVGLHFLSGDRSNLHSPYLLDPVPGADSATYWILLRTEASPAPDVFIQPVDRAVTAWIAAYRSRRPDLFTHPSGVRRITGVVLHGPSSQRSTAAGLDVRLVRFVESDSPLLEIEFDGGLKGERWDLRPVMPMILRR
jgi:hypothetical protein